MIAYEQFFEFAAKAGSLEGYLYEREKIEPLTNWVNNIDETYQKLPESVKGKIEKGYAIVLTRILSHGEKVMSEEIKSKLNSMLSELQG